MKIVCDFSRFHLADPTGYPFAIINSSREASSKASNGLSDPRTHVHRETHNNQRRMGEIMTSVDPCAFFGPGRDLP